MSFSVRIVSFSGGIASFSVRIELCHLVFGRIVSFSVRMSFIVRENCVI